MPEGGPLKVEALLPSADAFPFIRYGTFSGRIVAISGKAMAATKGSRQVAPVCLVWRA